MSADHIIDWFLLERYCAGTVTPAERTEIDDWIAADANRQEIVQRVQVALQARGHPHRRDWRRNEAIEAVLNQVQTGRQAAVVTGFPRRPSLEGSSTRARLVETFRHWFEGATDLAAAMLLDAKEQPLNDEETKALRDQINRQREDDES